MAKTRKWVESLINLIAKPPKPGQDYQSPFRLEWYIKQIEDRCAVEAGNELYRMKEQK